MKKFKQIRLLLTVFALLSTGALVAQTCVATAPVCVPGNGYAFRYAADTDFGLKFNTTTSDYEFTNGSGAAVMGIDANTGNIVIPGTGALQVGPNRYAFQFTTTPNYGLFFNAAGLDYEFRTASAAPIFSIGANSGNIRTNGSLGVGTFAPLTKLDVQGAVGVTTGLIRASVNHTITSDTRAVDGISVPAPGYGIGIAGTGGYMGVLGTNNGTTYTGGSYGGYFTASGTAGTRYGVYAYSTNSGANTSVYGSYNTAFSTGGLTAIGVYGSASGATNNWGGYFDGRGFFSEQVGIGTATPSTRLDVQQSTTLTSDALLAKVNYVGSVDARAVNAISITADGYGIGVQGQGGYKGVEGIASGGAYTGSAFGVIGSASGSAGTRYGLFGSAFGGTRNYAVYASGDSKVSGRLFVGTSTVSEDLAAFNYKVAVDGKIICEELRVKDSGAWPDYVFTEGYNLMSLEDLETRVKTDMHLPGIPSASQVAEEGIAVGAMQKQMMEKIEELTLYIIGQNNRMKAQDEKILILESEIFDNK